MADVQMLQVKTKFSIDARLASAVFSDKSEDESIGRLNQKDILRLLIQDPSL